MWRPVNNFFMVTWSATLIRPHSFLVWEQTFGTSVQRTNNENDIQKKEVTGDLCGFVITGIVFMYGGKTRDGNFTGDVKIVVWLCVS